MKISLKQIMLALIIVLFTFIITKQVAPYWSTTNTTSTISNSVMSMYFSWKRATPTPRATLLVIDMTDKRDTIPITAAGLVRNMGINPDSIYKYRITIDITTITDIPINPIVHYTFTLPYDIDAQESAYKQFLNDVDNHIAKLQKQLKNSTKPYSEINSTFGHITNSGDKYDKIVIFSDMMENTLACSFYQYERPSPNFVKQYEGILTVVHQAENREEYTDTFVALLGFGLPIRSLSAGLY